MNKNKKYLNPPLHKEKLQQVTPKRKNPHKEELHRLVEKNPLAMDERKIKKMIKHLELDKEVLSNQLHTRNKELILKHLDNDDVLDPDTVLFLIRKELQKDDPDNSLILSLIKKDCLLPGDDLKMQVFKKHFLESIFWMIQQDEESSNQLLNEIFIQTIERPYFRYYGQYSRVLKYLENSPKFKITRVNELLDLLVEDKISSFKVFSLLKENNTEIGMDYFEKVVQLLLNRQVTQKDVILLMDIEIIKFNKFFVNKDLYVEIRKALNSGSISRQEYYTIAAVAKVYRMSLNAIFS